MKVFVIHQSKSNRDIRKLMKRFPNITIVEPLKHKEAIKSLSLTVLKILEENNDTDVLIFEDDVKFTDSFNVNKLIEYANKYRSKIDLINTGVLLRQCSYVKSFDKDLKHVNYYRGSQCVLYLPTALNKLKQTVLTDIDRMLNLKCKGIVTYPSMTTQYDNDDAIHASDGSVKALFLESEKDIKWIK